MWKDIKNWEKYYEVNEYGEVRNKIKGNLIIGDINSEGYLRVCLYNKNNIPNKQRFFRHRLVTETFIPNPNNLPEVNHKDTNITNNHIDNLEWCTKEENELHSRKYGSKDYKPYKVIFANGIVNIYDAKTQLAKELGVSDALIRAWLQNKSKTFNKYNIKQIIYISK